MSRSGMARVISILLTLLGTGLMVRAGQIHWQVWKAAESRKDLLEHLVDHTRTMTDQELHEARFWSRYGEHSRRTFGYFLMGGLCAGAAATWLGRQTRRTGV